MRYSFKLLFIRKIRMKLFVAFACLVVAINAASDQDLWVEFKNKHGKTYKSLREEKLRFNIFQDKLREIEAHNEKYEKGEVSYFLAVNQFSDMTTEEFAQMLNENIATKPDQHATLYEQDVEANAPEAIDWVEKGAVLGVKNQGECGSCWAFSATGSIEGQNAIKNNKSVPLSEQQLVDCSFRNNGCSGGNMKTAFDYVKMNGLASEAAYPYIADDGSCKEAESVVEVKGYVAIPANESALQSAVGTVGPISVGVAARLWHSYGGGVFDNPECNTLRLNHGVLVVGYGVANGTNYWLIKNSWGPTWGEQGYIRLIRDKDNQCGVAKDASYPLM